MSPRPDRRLDRRTLFKAALGAGLSLPLAWPARAQFQAFPFSLGVASGEPAADGFVIWTRLAPEPLAPWGGMSPAPVAVTWEVATDPGMTTVVRAGSAMSRLGPQDSVPVGPQRPAAPPDYVSCFLA